MDGNMKVKIVSQVNGNVGIYLPNLKFSRDLVTKGQFVVMPGDMLEEAMFDPGFRSMVETGVIYIDSLEAAKELGLEEEDAEEPTRYKRFTEFEIKRLVNSASAEELREALEIMPKEQQRELGDWAITLRMRDSEKVAIVKEFLNLDVDKGIYLESLSQEG